MKKALKHSAFRYHFAGMIGNVLEHYDNALFGFLAPFIAPLFFGNHDPIVALILTYGMLPLGLLTRPLGSLFFGWIGDRFSRRQALFYSLFGMAMITVGIGSLPIYRDIGSWAPISLAIGRMLQNFFASGETVGGAIFVLEHTDLVKRNLISSIYDALSIGGILIASGLVTLLSYWGCIETGWRVLFWIGGLTAILGIFLRLSTQESSEFANSKAIGRPQLMQLLYTHKGILLRLVIVSGFSYITYSLSFTLMNGYVPLVTFLTKTDVMKVNTELLVMDMLLLPCFGYLANKFDKKKIMCSAALCSAVVAIPMFACLNQAGIGMVIVIRIVLVILGVSFAATYHAWAIEQVPPHTRYTVLSLGYAIGSQLIGAPTAAICLWLYQKMSWSAAPGIYIMVIAMTASYVIYHDMKAERKIIFEIQSN
jgi:MFS transporter, MHS family, proline/betaine transporter